MKEKLLSLTKELININSVSSNSSKEAVLYIDKLLESSGFITEILTYSDGEDKYNLVAQRGSGGVAFITHIDTVPLFSDEQLVGSVKNNRIYGRGACDMKGPIAAALLAAINTDEPVTIIVASDEEVGCIGAKYIAENSTLLKSNPPDFAIVTEPTELIPVYSHKGLGMISVKGEGSAAHSSTDLGINANFLTAPFIYHISRLKERYLKDEEYKNSEFTPASNGLNMVISDNNCPLNITAETSKVLISFRSMPGCRSEEIIDEITEIAKECNLKYKFDFIPPHYVDPDSYFVKKAEEITGRKAGTVPYLTDAFRFKELNPIILGPGSIKEAHTDHEYIDINQLIEGYNIYRAFITV